MGMKKLLAPLTLALIACASQKSPPTSEAASSASPVAAQAARGAELYGMHCAHCHGAQGQGTNKGPAVVGPDALPLHAEAGAERKVEFRTALDVFNWVKVAMPGDDAGSLSAEEYVAILAFDLKANGVKLDRPLDAELAKELVLHP